MAAAVIRLRVAARVVAAVAGSYAVTAGTAALVAVLLIAVLGLSRADALIIGCTVAYLLFAALMLWCVAERRLSRVWLLLLVAALITHGMAALVEPSLPMTGVSS